MDPKMVSVLSKDQMDGLKVLLIQRLHIAKVKTTGVPPSDFCVQEAEVEIASFLLGCSGE